MTDVLSDSVKENLMKQIPMGRLGKINDIADLVLFLVSEKAGYITGEVIRVDGGMAM
jgi:3-oxoacyl-[acyl-carrier protein] reductase